MDRQNLIFLDTDFGPDCDDVAALAILLELCHQGYGNLIGITHCTASAYGLPAIDTLCRLFGQNPPMGTCRDKRFLDVESTYAYTPAVVDAFPHGYPPELPQPDAVETMTRVLKDVPDASVTLVTIGPLINIGHALQDDSVCKLMHRKISRIISMAGSFDSDPPTAEWNVLMDISSARMLIDRWKGELLLCPFEPMDRILTGACLNRYPDNPATVAYRIHTKGTMLRPSWDLTATAACALEMNGPFSWSEPGKVTIDEKGVSFFAPDPEGKHRYLRLSGTIEEGAAFLEDLLEQAVQTMSATL